MSEFDQDLAVIVEMINRGDIMNVVSAFEELLEENSRLRIYNDSYNEWEKYKNQLSEKIMKNGVMPLKKKKGD
jgi:coenzyme F420-reducing hydrogenase delta subunit